MSSLNKYIFKIIFILKGKYKYLFLLFISFISLSLIDIIGISFVTAFMSLMIGSENFIFFEHIKSFFVYLNIYSPSNFLNILIYTILFIYISKSIVTYLIQLWIIHFSLNIEAWLRSNLMESFLGRPYKYILNENASNIVNIAGVYTNTFQTSVLMQGIKLLSESIVILMVMSFLAYNEPLSVMLVLIIFLIFFFIYNFFVSAAISKTGHVANKFYGSIIKSINEAIFSIKEIKIFNRSLHFLDEINKNTKTVNKARFIQDALKLIPKYAIELLIILIVMSLAFIFINFYNYKNNDFIILLTLFAAAAFRLMPALTQSITSINSLRSSKIVVSEIYESMIYLENYKSQSYEKIDHGNTNFKITPFSTINLENINFRYSMDSDYVLNNINLSINKGDCIGIVGTSGSGKTTLINLIMGLLEFDDGKITIDNTNFVNLSPLQFSISYIPQNIYLLDDTIIRNITFENNENKIDFDRLQNAIESAQLSKFINSQPKNIHSIIGENGVKLSGGQRQRIAIARALYFEREIIILDEATSSLDNLTEHEIVECINNLRGDKTIIVVAHRESTLKYCDKVYLIQNGALIRNEKTN